MSPPSPGESDFRMQIYAYVQEHPAAHILEIAQVFDLSHPTVMYHLKLLQDEGYLVSTLWGKRRVHFDTQAHFNAWEREVLALMAQKEACAIFEHVAASPGTYPRQIAQVLGVSETTVKRYVPELVRLQLVAQGDGFRRRLELAKVFERRGSQLMEKVPRDTEAWHRLAALLPESTLPESASAEAVEVRIKNS